MLSSSNEQTFCPLFADYTFGDLFYIQCPANQYISIKNAWFGRNDIYTCLNYVNNYDCAACSTNCYLNITTLFQNFSNGKNSYTFSYSPSTDPCFGTWKYFKIDYTCSSNYLNAIMALSSKGNFLNYLDLYPSFFFI